MTSNFTQQDSLFHNLNGNQENNQNIDYVQKFSECNEFIYLENLRDQDNEIQNLFSEIQSNDCLHQNLFQDHPEINSSTHQQTQKQESTTGSQNGKTSTQEQDNQNFPLIDNSKFPKLQKRIKKQYEPLFDNNMYYDYSKNPEEYKKARKRIQNRQSATRVRHRKVNNFMTLEQQFEEISSRNTELMLENARLQAENNLLQQQLSFLQKMLIKEKTEQIDHNNNCNIHNNNNNQNNNLNQFQNQNYQEYVLPVSKIHQQQQQQESQMEMTNGIWNKIPGNGSGKENRNLSFLGMMTMIFCFIAFFSTGQEQKLLSVGQKSIDMTDPEKVGELFKSFELQPKSNDQQAVTNAKEIFIATLIQQIMKKYNNKYEIVFEILEIGFLILYIGFILYVLVKLICNYLKENQKVKIS